jgi:hypothetical protein
LGYRWHTAVEARPTLMNFFLIFNAILPGELSIWPPRLEREIWIHESATPVPTGITARPQAGKKVTSVAWKKQDPMYVDKIRRGFWDKIGREGAEHD